MVEFNYISLKFATSRCKSNTFSILSCTHCWVFGTVRFQSRWRILIVFRVLSSVHSMSMSTSASTRTGNKLPLENNYWTKLWKCQNYNLSTLSTFDSVAHFNNNTTQSGTEKQAWLTTERSWLRISYHPKTIRKWC